MFKVKQKGQHGWSEVSEGNWWEVVGPDHIGPSWDISCGCYSMIENY